GVERVLLVRVRGNELAEVLLTIGVAFIVADICLAIFGGNPMSLSVSEWLKGSLTFGPMPYPKYRLFIIGFTVLVGIALYLFQQRSRLGAMIQDRKSTRLNSSHVKISYAVFCLKKKKNN